MTNPTDWEPSEAMKNAARTAWKEPFEIGFAPVIIAVRPLIIAEEQERNSDQMIEIYQLAHEWRVAHDKLLAGKPYDLPKPIPVPEIIAQIEAAERERMIEHLEDYYGDAIPAWLPHAIRALKDSKP